MFDDALHHLYRTAKLPHNSMILRNAIRGILIRDLEGLQRQVSLYPDDESLWKVAPGIANSAGTLVLHLAGNLRHFCGAVLGGTGYERNRDAEFSTRGLSRAELESEARATIDDVEAALNTITADQLEAVYPVPLREMRVRTADFLVHLAVHLGYHLGQIDYHRRLLTPDPRPADAVALEPLGEMLIVT